MLRSVCSNNWSIINLFKKNKIFWFFTFYKPCESDGEGIMAKTVINLVSPKVVISGEYLKPVTFVVVIITKVCTAVKKLLRQEKTLNTIRFLNT